MKKHWQHAAMISFAITASMTSAACAPATTQAAQVQAPSAPAAALVEGDELDRTLKAEGLLGVLKRIDAELGHTLQDDKFVSLSAPSSRSSAKLVSSARFDEAPLVTWGGSDSSSPSLDEPFDAPDVQR